MFEIIAMKTVAHYDYHQSVDVHSDLCFFVYTHSNSDFGNVDLCILLPCIHLMKIVADEAVGAIVSLVQLVAECHQNHTDLKIVVEAVK